MTPEEILGAAADYIEEHGWCQYVLWDGEGRVCLQGALQKVTKNVAYCPARDQAARALRVEVQFQFYSVWNDLYCSSKEEAISALRNAKRFL